MKKLIITGICLMSILGITAEGVDYKKNVVTSTATNTSTFITYSSSGGSSMSRATSQHFDFDNFGMEKLTLDEQINIQESKLNRLYFIRDVCPLLESEIAIKFEKRDIREVMTQLSNIIGTELPFNIPSGQFMVESSDISGMPADQFLDAIASVCGLELSYLRDRIVFSIPVEKSEE